MSVVKTEKASTDLSKYMIGRTASYPVRQLPLAFKSRQPSLKRALNHSNVDSIGAGNIIFKAFKMCFMRIDKRNCTNNNIP